VAGVRGKSGRTRRAIFSRAYRITLGSRDADLLPFFKDLDKLSSDRRNATLLAAIRGGAGAAQDVMTRSESRKAAQAIDAILSTFDQE
jgi:hypothetical protein